MRKAAIPFLALVAGVALACGGNGPQSPLQPTRSIVPTLTINGPAVLTRGQVGVYTATVRAADGTSQVQTGAAEWTTSDAAIASAGPEGLVTPHLEGAVDVRAAFMGLRASMPIRVEAVRLQISGRAMLTARGETSQLTLTATRADGSREDATSVARWVSADPTIASITAPGLVTALRTGRADVEATHEGASARLTIVVTLPLPGVIVDLPASDPTSLTVTFGWRLLNADPERTYRFQIRLDKGSNACDGFVEEAFDAGTNSRFTVTLDGRRYSGQSVDFGVQAEDGRGFQTCAQGRRFRLP